MFFGLDPLYWLMMAPVLLISFIASSSVKGAFSKYSKQRVSSGKTGADVAREILDRNGLSRVQVLRSSGFLSDHYDPAKRVVRLSPAVYDNDTISAIGVAAHETGHAIQHAKSYSPLILRNMMVPLASFGSYASYIIIFLGFIFGAMGLAKVGVVFFTLVVIFQIITLPVEFDASSRAKKLITSYGIVSRGELLGVNKVLNAAAMTYVAAAISAIVTLLYYLIRLGILGGGDD